MAKVCESMLNLGLLNGIRRQQALVLKMAIAFVISCALTVEGSSVQATIRCADGEGKFSLELLSSPLELSP